MSKSDRTTGLLFLLLISVGGLVFTALILQAFTWAPVFLSSVSWNGGIV